MSIFENEKLKALPDTVKEKKLSNLLRTSGLLNKIRSIPASDIRK
jgi:hypothetical protein